MLKRIIGWLLILVGAGGLLANIAFLAIRGGEGAYILVFNSLVCGLLVLAGSRLIRQRPRASGGRVSF